MNTRAMIAYAGRSLPRPRYYANDHSRDVLDIDLIEMDVTDARARAPTLDDAGFTLVAHRSAVTDFAERAAVEAVHRPEIVALVQQLSGADLVVVTSPGILRFSERSPRSGVLDNSRPARFAHVDVSDATAATFAQRAAPPGRPLARFVHYNVWRALSPPPQDVPLAVCDARSVDAADLIAADAVFDSPGKPERALRAARRLRSCRVPRTRPAAREPRDARARAVVRLNDLDLKGDAVPSFANTPEFTGLNTPIGAEYELAALPVEGRIPAEVAGTFFRAIPDPAFPPYTEDGAAVLSGDGMVSALRFAPDKVSFAIRYVQTERHRAEVGAGRALFGKYRNPFTDRPEAAGLDRTVANTTPLWHAGRLLMTKEDGRPYRMDPHTLATLGRYDFGGRLKSATVTAHARIDPQTGEMFFFGYEADGLASTTVAYCIADARGNLMREQWFDAPYCAMMHDFTVTERYALFPIYPTTCDLARLQAGGDHWVHELQRDSWVGVMPRYGSVAELRWFRGPKGVSCYHMMNAFEDADGRVHLDQCLSNVNAFPFIQRASGINVAPGETGGRLARWTIDLRDGSERPTETTIGPPGDLPVIPAANQGRPYGHGWMLTMNPAMHGPPVAGGPVGVMFNTLLRLDFTGKPPQALALPAGHCLSEPVHVPSSRSGHEGWLLTIVDRQTGESDFAHTLWILDAGNVTAGPIARVPIAHRLRPQVHGWWVSAAELAAAS